jgi:hypothetical protein
MHIIPGMDGMPAQKRLKAQVGRAIWKPYGVKRVSSELSHCTSLLQGRSYGRGYEMETSSPAPIKLVL